MSETEPQLMTSPPPMMDHLSPGTALLVLDAISFADCKVTGRLPDLSGLVQMERLNSRFYTSETAIGHVAAISFDLGLSGS